MSSYFLPLHRAVQAGTAAAVVTVVAGAAQGNWLLVIEGQPVLGSLGDPESDAAAEAAARRQLARQERTRLQLGAHDLFIDLYLPRQRLIIVGAVHTAIPLVAFANRLGFHTIVLDARAVFATPERFPHADSLTVAWPADTLAELDIDASTFIVVLTHDPKIDNPVLMLALDSSARYIGALGSRRTHATRCAELRALGATEAQLARIHAPIGLDLGGRRPEEIALAIMAEIVAVQNNHRADFG